MTEHSTSLEAYIAEQPLITSQLEQVKNFFRRYPTVPFSDPDLCRSLHLASNIVESRRSKLLSEGYIERVQDKVNWATGHRVRAYRWRLK